MDLSLLDSDLDVGEQRLRGPDPEPVHQDGPGSTADTAISRRQCRLHGLGPAADLRRQSSHPGERYKNTVGVSAVRDQFGALQNEGASKGILVTTSGYRQASFDFAKNKELIDGSNLLYLLAEHASIEAEIVPPDDSTDLSPIRPNRATKLRVTTGSTMLRPRTLLTLIGRTLMPP